MNDSDHHQNRGDGLAQWLVRWTAGDPKVEGSNPVRSTRKTEFFRVKKVVCPTPVLYTDAYERPCKDPVVHVRVWWIMET